MKTIVLKSVPARLYARLKKAASAQRRSLTQETLHLIEVGLAAEEAEEVRDYWKNRKLLSDWRAARDRGAFAGGTDSSALVSHEREER